MYGPDDAPPEVEIGFLLLVRLRSIRKAAATRAMATAAIAARAHVGRDRFVSLFVLRGGGVDVADVTGMGAVPVSFIGPKFWMSKL